MTISSIKVQARQSKRNNLRDPDVVRALREEAEKAVREEHTRRRLRRLRATFTR